MNNTAVTVTARNGFALAQQVNEAFAAGTVTEVDGHKLKSQFGAEVATTWQNGTVSFTVEARAKGKVNTVFRKVGQSFTAS
jgi:hypothetical protein